MVCSRPIWFLQVSTYSPTFRFRLWLFCYFNSYEIADATCSLPSSALFSPRPGSDPCIVHRPRNHSTRPLPATTLMPTFKSSSLLQPCRHKSPYRSVRFHLTSLILYIWFNNKKMSACSLTRLKIFMHNLDLCAQRVDQVAIRFTDPCVNDWTLSNCRSNEFLQYSHVHDR